MVAFKEEFPYLRTDSGQLFEFNRDWLHAAITRAADEAGYPSWWLTDHVTESIAFYLRLLNNETESDRLQGDCPAFYSLAAAHFYLVGGHCPSSGHRIRTRVF
ncbi:MAG: hypothetical protein DME72_03645 [Verrucomicrobia bacterium]|nr:MAG: hypothetical protein DME72_03645 [Verrucomicrobiota bacterium]